MNFHALRPDLSMILTAIISGLSLAMLNTVLTTIVLGLTVIYWVQRNWRMFKNKDKGDELK